MLHGLVYAGLKLESNPISCMLAITCLLLLACCRYKKGKGGSPPYTLKKVINAHWFHHLGEKEPYTCSFDTF